jgi:hypothetical protein
MPADAPRRTDDVSGAARAAEGHGGDAPDAIEPLEPEDFDPLDAEGGSESAAPPQVSELAAGCIRFMGARYGIVLEFERDTLSFLDQWLRDARVELAQSPESTELVQAAAGAYLGEVIRRAFGGEWLANGGHETWRVALSTVYCSFNPIGMAREALRLGPAEGWHAHFELDPGEREAVEERLGALPAVDDEEYYAPSTRFDVVEIVVETLRAAMLARGLSDVRFGLDDYR